MLITQCPICGSRDSAPYLSAPVEHGTYSVCSRCELVWLNEEQSKAELVQHYRREYHNGIYTHTFEEDMEAAKIRFRAYYRDLPQDSRVLDVGCGNGAFLKVCEARGVEAVGTDLAIGASESVDVYEQDLLDIHFPTDYFDAISLFDVLEHVPNPLALLKECHRILKQNGKIVVEIPAFWAPEGKKHWKPEHLWYFDIGNLKDLLQDAGFTGGNVSCTHPHIGKVAVFTHKPEEDRPTILVPPGVGDCYWPMVKMQSFLKSRDLGIPDIHICSTKPELDRSIDYVRRIPFVNAAGYLRVDNKGPIWKEAYKQNGRTIFEDVYGVDYFLAYNGVTRFGRSIDNVDPDLDTDWFFPMWQSLEERRYAQYINNQYGPYICVYVIPHGPYKRWLNEFPLSETYSAIERICSFLKVKGILIGAKWDKDTLDTQLMAMDKGQHLINLVGKTTLPECFGLLRGAVGTVGYPSGITIMSTVFRKPTVMLWNRYYHRNFHWYSCPPQARNNWYEAIDTSEANRPRVVRAFLNCVNRDNPDRTEKELSKIEALPPKPIPQVIQSATAHAATAKFQGVSVACVLKSGGDYTKDYVLKLKNAVQKHLPVDHNFVCLTDEDIPEVCTVPLLHKWPGWWSKLELFRPDLFGGPVIYLDLDTVILRGIHSLILPYNDSFAMLESFANPKMRASGVMCWHGDYSFIYREMIRQQETCLKPKRNGTPQPDQKFIARLYRTKMNKRADTVQFHSGLNILSYKNHILTDEGDEHIPSDTDIVCFHGEPRPHDVKALWLEENWQ